MEDLGHHMTQMDTALINTIDPLYQTVISVISFSHHHLITLFWQLSKKKLVIK